MSDRDGENRAVVLTAPGAAGIAVVRVVGPRVADFLARRFSRPAKPGRCVHGELWAADGHVIDDPVVVSHDRGADLNVHGGPWVVRSLLDLVAAEGFEVIEAGRTGPMPVDATDAPDAIGAEIEMWLPVARTELAVRVLLAQARAWERLAGDHSPEVTRRVLNDLSLVWLLNPPRVAIVGPANVGKSTLANRLFAQERSIVADVPGTTRDWVGELANVNGLAVMLVDTPGVRHTHDPVERVAIERSGEQVRRADLAVVVLDGSRPLAGEQAELLARFPESLVVVNKADRPLGEGMAAVKGIRTVASAGEGVDRVRTEVCRRFGCDGVHPAVARWWTPRQRAWLVTHLADET